MKKEELTEFELQEVKIGTLSDNADYRKLYKFKGEELAFVRTYDSARSRDDRGTDKTLYRIGQDKYLVLIEEWTRWQGEANYSHFYREEETPEETPYTVLSGREVADKFPDLVNKAGLLFPITLNFPNF